MSGNSSLWWLHCGICTPWGDTILVRLTKAWFTCCRFQLEKLGSSSLMASGRWTQFYKVAVGCFPFLQFTAFSVNIFSMFLKHSEEQFTHWERSWDYEHPPHSFVIGHSCGRVSLMISVLNPFRKLDMPFALCSFPPCIHSHVTAKYSVNIFQIPTKYIAQYLIER